VSRIGLITWVTLFFISNLAIFYALGMAGVGGLGVPFFLWVGIFNVMAIAQFWAFANDIYTPQQGKRLFPIVGLGASLGAWIGSMRAGDLVAVMGPQRLLVGAGAILVGCVLLIQILSRRVRRQESPAQIEASDQPLDTEGGFQLIASDRYLMLIAGLTVLLNVVNTSGEYLFGRYVVDTANSLYGTGQEAAAARERFIGTTYSELFSMVNLIGFLLQMFVVSRVFKYLGVGKALFIHPLIAGSGYVLMLVAPSFGAMRWLKIADNSVDYSLGNTTKQALWLPTSRVAKYKAKQAVDSFFMRAGDVVQAGIVFLGERLVLAVPGFAALNILLVGAWLSVSAMINLHLRRTAATEHTAVL
jgi:AAA family ATP:ADP antiporter